MTLSSVAGLIAALAFVVLVGLLAVPVLKLGHFFDRAASSVEEVTGHTLPILDEAVTTVTQANTQLEKVDSITTSAAETSQNISALVAVISATVGSPLIKLASFTYGVRQAFSRKPKGGN